MLSLHNAVLMRGGEKLLDGANLTLHPGRHVGLIGRNGCGKTSLFRLLLGELSLDGGELKKPPGWRLAHMAQEVSSANRSALDFVLDGDIELRQVQQAIINATEQHCDDALPALYATLENLHGYSAERRAGQLLHGLGFNATQWALPVNRFSGGWRIRLNLAQALMSPSDLLLLDEPTNHLDLDATLWLGDWLKAYPGTLLLISHDRDFLDAVAQDIVHIEHCQLNSYRGNYSTFEVTRAMRLAEQQVMFEKQERRRAEIDDFVRRFSAKASKARQAQSRLKELSRMAQIAPAHVDSPFYFRFRDGGKTSTPLLALKDATLGYGETGILHNVSVQLQPGACVGLLGVNGAGKSTLVKSLVGDLPLLAGERVAGEHLRIGYFAQHQLEALDLDASAVQHVQRLSPQVREQDIRQFLGGFDFHGDRALAPIAPFSGGEKARLALALVVWQRPNLLLLDEPTNHLDLEMREALTEALLAYDGALIVISHDSHLLRNTADEFWSVQAGQVVPFAGTLEDYHRLLQQQQAAVPTAASAEEGAEARQDKKALRQQAAAERQRLAPLRKRVITLEQSLERLQAELDAIDLKLGDSTLYDTGRKAELQTVLATQGQLRKQKTELETEWFQCQETLEASDNTDR